jgi:hypothetical protein
MSAVWSFKIPRRVHFFLSLLINNKTLELKEGRLKMNLVDFVRKKNHVAISFFLLCCC